MELEGLSQPKPSWDSVINFIYLFFKSTLKCAGAFWFFYKHGFAAKAWMNQRKPHKSCTQGRQQRAQSIQAAKRNKFQLQWFPNSWGRTGMLQAAAPAPRGCHSQEKKELLIPLCIFFHGKIQKCILKNKKKYCINLYNCQLFLHEKKITEFLWGK